MKPTVISTILFCALVWLAACAPSAPQPAPTQNDTEGDLETRGFINTPDGKLRVSGKGPFLLALKQLASPPAPPAGWEFVGPVFDITARDRQQRPVRQFAAPLLLRFDVAENRPLTVLVHTENGWQIVPSDLDAEGKLIANVDHLTPYTVGAPVSANSAAPGSATRAATIPASSATRVPTLTPGSLTRVPTVTPGTRLATQTPGARVTVSSSPVASSEASSALKTAAEAIKQKTVTITSAAGYAGSLYVAVPPVLQNALGSAIGVGGTGYYGFYNVVNEVVLIQAAGSRGAATGTLTLLVEPKTSMPANATDAKTQLTALFPGVTATLTQATSATSGYVFYGVSGTTAYSLGYVSYNGLTLAYALAGTGTYSSLVPK